jgi:hypothetical protein
MTEAKTEQKKEKRRITFLPVGKVDDLTHRSWEQ